MSKFTTRMIKYIKKYISKSNLSIDLSYLGYNEPYHK